MNDGAFDHACLQGTLNDGAFDHACLQVTLNDEAFDPAYLQATLNDGAFDPAYLQVTLNDGAFAPAYLQATLNDEAFDHACLQVTLNDEAFGPAYLQATLNDEAFDPAYLQATLNDEAFADTEPRSATPPHLRSRRRWDIARGKPKPRALNSPTSARYERNSPGQRPAPSPPTPKGGARRPSCVRPKERPESSRAHLRSGARWDNAAQRGQGKRGARWRLDGTTRCPKSKSGRHSDKPAAGVHSEEERRPSAARQAAGRQ